MIYWDPSVPTAIFWSCDTNELPDRAPMNPLPCHELELMGCLEILFQLVRLGVNSTVDSTVHCIRHTLFAQELIHLC
jgi:hypothetical protein